MLKNTKRNFAAILLAILTLTLLSGCLKKDPTQKTTAPKAVTLVYYKLFDQEDVISPMIQQYQALHPNVVIKYKKFDNTADYFRTILNSLAEGEGPDIFSVPNYWLMRNAKKVTPMPPDYYNPKTFEDTFVSVAANDLVFNDPRDGVRKVFGLPLTVDTLALYYNKDQYEDKVPSRGKPPATWADFKNDVFDMTIRFRCFDQFNGLAKKGTSSRCNDFARCFTPVNYRTRISYFTRFGFNGHGFTC